MIVKDFLIRYKHLIFRFDSATAYSHDATLWRDYAHDVFARETKNLQYHQFIDVLLYVSHVSAGGT